MLKRILEFILLMLIWIGLVWSVQPSDLIAGFVVSLIIVLLFSDIFPAEVTRLLSPVRIFWILVYLPVFFWRVILSNLDVTYRVFHPEIPIRPGIVKVKTTLKSEIGKSFLANSITLTPGTLTVDCVGEYLYIHWINIISDDPEVETKIIVGYFEKYLKRIFE